MSSVELKEGCYVGDFALGRSQIKVSGAGVAKTVIHGDLVLQTQCVVLRTDHRQESPEHVLNGLPIGPPGASTPVRRKGRGALSRWSLS